MLSSSTHDELYEGYNDLQHSAFNTKNLQEDEYLQEALRSSYGKRSRLVSIVLFYFLIIEPECTPITWCS